jgi:hypothetical protein
MNRQRPCGPDSRTSSRSRSPRRRAPRVRSAQPAADQPGPGAPLAWHERLSRVPGSDPANQTKEMQP